MATAAASENTKISGQPNPTNPTETLKENYNAIGYGNNHGSIRFGAIHKNASTTAAVMLTTPDGRHKFCMDEDGDREKGTTITSPGIFQIESGSDLEEGENAIFFDAKHGDMSISVPKGKLRITAMDIEINIVGAGGDTGNLQLNATQDINIQAGKKFIVNAGDRLKIVSPNLVEIAGNSCLKLYGSIIRGVSDACKIKNDKNAGGKIQDENNQV